MKIMQLEMNTELTLLKAGAMFLIEEDTIHLEIYLKIRFLPWMTLY